MKDDRLLTLLLKRLEKISETKESEEEVIHHVTAQYMVELMTIGNVPHYLLDSLERDLVEELREMYRKKTYGSLNPVDYSNQVKRRRVRKVIAN